MALQIAPLDPGSCRGRGDRPRLLRTREEIFAAGYEEGARLAPLTEAQINLLAALFAPTLNKPGGQSVSLPGTAT